jgi:hypothetical protein
MIRTTTRLSTLSSSLMLAAFFVGCGGGSPASNGKAGHDGGTAGATGSAGATAGATGTAGDNGAAGAAGDNGGGGATAGTAGGVAGSAGGAAGGAGSAAGGTGGGTAGSGAGTAGTSGNGGVGGGTAGTGAGGAKADAGTDAGPTSCMPGSTCAVDFTCTNTRACGPNREQFCFCDPNGKVACEACTANDAGVSTDAGTLKMCPANATMRTATCTMNAERCAASACTNMKQEVCICAVFGGAATGRWFCNTIACQ